VAELILTFTRNSSQARSYKYGCSDIVLFPFLLLLARFHFFIFRIPHYTNKEHVQRRGNLWNQYGHVVFLSQQSHSFRTGHSAFYLPHSTFRKSALYQHPNGGRFGLSPQATLSYFVYDRMRRTECSALVPRPAGPAWAGYFTKPKHTSEHKRRHTYEYQIAQYV